eukprot:904818-Prorocentrum_minimum.AAC.1
MGWVVRHRLTHKKYDLSNMPMVDVWIAAPSVSTSDEAVKMKKIVSMFGVFDGNQGSEVSKLLAEQLTPTLCRQLNRSKKNPHALKMNAFRCSLEPFSRFHRITREA